MKALFGGQLWVGILLGLSILSFAPQREDQGNGQDAKEEGEEAQGEFAVAGQGDPGAKQQKVEGAILSLGGEHGQQVWPGPGGESQGVYFVAPQALVAQVKGTDAESQQNQDD